MYYVYILLCSDNSLYTGIAKDIAKRHAMHSAKKGAKYMKSRLPFKHIYTEEFETKQLAMKREFQIKRWPRQRKISELGLNLN